MEYKRVCYATQKTTITTIIGFTLLCRVRFYGIGNTMITFNPDFLEQTSFLDEYEITELNDLSQYVDFHILMATQHNDKSLLSKMSFDFIYTSAKIEGNSYTRGEALTLFETRKPMGHKRIDEAIMLFNIKEAFEYVLQYRPTINKHTIRELHQILSQNLLPKKAQGGVRLTEVYISNSNYIPLNNPQELENQLDRILNISQEIVNPYNQAIYLHNNIAYLQYFQDCNKRLARLVQNLSLINNNLPFLSYDAQRAESQIMAQYKDSLITYYEQGNAQSYKDFFISEYKKTLEVVKTKKQYQQNSLHSQLKILKQHTDIFATTLSPTQKEQSYKKIVKALENIENLIESSDTDSKVLQNKNTQAQSTNTVSQNDTENLLNQDSNIALDKKDSMLIQKATKLVDEYEKSISRNKGRDR